MSKKNQLDLNYITDFCDFTIKQLYKFDFD